MSTRKGAPKKGAPKHQNDFTYKHNKNSKLTTKIQSIPHTNLCKRCWDKIEWRKKFRKYKPITVPRRCNACDKKSVHKAYHVLCDPCAKELDVCAKCMDLEVYKSEKELEAEMAEEEENIEEELDGLPLRVKRSIMRKREKAKQNEGKEEDDEEEEKEEEEKEEDEYVYSDEDEYEDDEIELPKQEPIKFANERFEFDGDETKTPTTSSFKFDEQVNFTF